MKELVDFAILCCGSLFVIVDPIAAVPAFLAMTERNTREERVRMARTASLVTFLILLAFSLFGRWLIARGMRRVVVQGG